MSDFVPARTGLSRVFLIERRAGPDHAPAFQACMRAQAVSKTLGDITDIECPDPNRPGAYIKVGDFQTGDERATVTLEGRLALELRSTLLKLASKKCPLDLQLHFGECEDLSDFHSFQKVLMLEAARISTYDTEDLGSLQSSDEAPINEMAEVSARVIYDIINQTFALKAEDLVTNEAIDAVVCDEVSCGDCSDESDGCEKAFVLTIAAGGSPSTPADVVFTVDGGETWYAHDVDTLGAAEDPDALACLVGYLVVVSNDSASLHYADLDDFDAFGTDPTWTEVTTGFETGGEPNAISSIGVVAFVVGDGGYIYKLTDPPSGVEVQDAGTATTDNLLAVDALSATFAVAVGQNGAIVVAEDGETWQVAESTPVGAGIHLNTVAVKSRSEWWIGTSDGRVFYTKDGGEHWTQKGFPGDGSGVVRDIVIATDSIMYISHDTTAPRGRILASFNGGYSFKALPMTPGVLPATDRFSALAACKADPELLLAVGLADDGSDGSIVVGRM